MAERGEEEERYYYSDESSYTGSSYSDDSSIGELEDEVPVERRPPSAGERYFVTRESQENLTELTRKYSYAGLRDLSELDKIQEQDIVGSDGSIRGVRNRVRAGLANFEDKAALEKVCWLAAGKGGGAD